MLKPDAFGLGQIKHARVHFPRINAEDVHAALDQRIGGAAGGAAEIESGLPAQIKLIPATPGEGLFKLEPGS